MPATDQDRTNQRLIKLYSHGFPRLLTKTWTLYWASDHLQDNRRDGQTRRTSPPFQNIWLFSCTCGTLRTRKAFSVNPFRHGQRAQDLLVLRRQKKAFDLLLLLGDVLKPGQQLREQRQQQGRLGARGDGIGAQLRRMQRLQDLGGSLVRPALSSVLEDLSDLLEPSAQRCLWRGRALQEDQGTVLLPPGLQRQGERIVGRERGRERIEQAGVHLDQGVLVRAESLKLLHHLTGWGQSRQIGQMRTPRFGEPIGITGSGFGSRGTTPAMHCRRVKRVERPTRLQQESDERARFDIHI
jgi:hypothetical protein